LSNGFHPYNSRRNDEVRNWLLTRIDDILHENDAKYEVREGDEGLATSNGTKPVVVYNDLSSNATFSNKNLTIYFEGTNIMVYVRGFEEQNKGGVLVNAHYDSVSSGFGTTDDGVGVITILQLISHFTKPKQQPRRGIVFLLNNGEEDFLNGAYAFMRHPLSDVPHTFLNLEGAGAGGRAALFRSTDTEVTRFYRRTQQPFGNVITADGFKRGLVRSQTDYVVFNGELGMRGLDVAFMAPRARYHTVEDSTKFTSAKSVWHMLSAALDTVKGLSADGSDGFDGRMQDNGKVNSGEGTESVWFDLLGRAFAVFELHSLFAISVTLLVAGPVILIAIHAILSKLNKYYLFSRKAHLNVEDDEEPGGSDPVPLNGLRGFFRFPIAFILATAAAVGLAFLVNKTNPLIVYNSEYSVWAMMLAAWLFLAWFVLRGAYEMRPTALQRAYSIFWTYILTWIMLVAATVGENNFMVAGTYFLAIYGAASFVALLLTYLDLFALPRKSTYARKMTRGIDHDGSLDAPLNEAASYDSRPIMSRGEDDANPSPGDADDEATERTSLLRSNRQTFGRGYGRQHAADENEDETETSAGPKPYVDEQPWSSALPGWTWTLQFLVLSVVPVILVGQIALLGTSALHQTPADGSPVLPIYIMISILTVLLLLPITPFLHRFSYQVPAFLFLICAGTLIYNLTAFPFSENAKLKVYFQQSVNLDTGLNNVSLTGLDGYTQSIIATLPSAEGNKVDCTTPELVAKRGLTKCSWPGLAPAVVPSLAPPSGIPPEKAYKDWLSFNISRPAANSTSLFNATVSVAGKDTRACKILFDRPVSYIHIHGSSSDRRFKPVGEHGTTELRLWSREWDNTWRVDVGWAASSADADADAVVAVQARKDKNKGKGGEAEPLGMDGRVVCLWSDANESGTVPALEELWRFAPRWSVPSKAGDGLVEGWKAFTI